MIKRVLIITYYWPPYTGSGVQRWLKFAKYLPQYGWQPVIYTPENPDTQLQDPDLLNDVSEETEVLKKRIWDPSRFIRKGKDSASQDGYSRIEGKSKFMRLFKWIRGNIFIPDSRVLWVAPSTTYLMSILRKNPVDLIVSTGPPHSMHLIAERLSRKTGIKWVMDLRDPMSQLITNRELSMSASARRKYQALESRLLNRADIVLATAPGMPSLLMPFDRGKFYTVTNGFDQDDFGPSSATKTNPFVLTYAGLLSQYRIPHMLLEVLHKLLQENPSYSSKFRFEIAGIVSDEFHKALSNYPSLQEKTTFKGYLNHREVIELYEKSTVLLLLMNNDKEDVEGSIPGKLFEYVASRRPILSLGPANSGLTTIFTADPHSAHLDYNAHDQIKLYFEQILSIDHDIIVNVENYAHFSRKSLTKKLVNILDNLATS